MGSKQRAYFIKAPNFSGLFGVHQLPFYLRKNVVLSHALKLRNRLGFSYVTNILKDQLFKILENRSCSNFAVRKDIMSKQWLHNWFGQISIYLFRDIRDLKIGRRDELRVQQEADLHNRACARELPPCEFAVVVTPRTPFREFCLRVENVGIFILF